MATPFRPNPSQPKVAVENIVSTSLKVGVPSVGDPARARCPQDLEAISWPEGKRIDLRWTNVEEVTHIIIKRSQIFNSAFLDDDTEIIYDGPNIDHFVDGKKVTETLGGPVGQQTPPFLEVGPPTPPSTEEDLQEDTYYYYTLYMTTAEEPIGLFDYGLEASSPCQVIGLSILDYFNFNEVLLERGLPTNKWYGEWFYNLFPAKTREHDANLAKAKGRERGYFRDMCRFVQGGFNIYRGHARAMVQLGDVGRTPAGLVGKAFDQSTILAAWARRFNIPPERFILDVGILRRIAASMIFIYKEKGTCPALVDFTKVLTRWDSECIEIDPGIGPCNPIFLSTWDGDETEILIIRQLSSITIAAGAITVPGLGLVVDDHMDSLVIGSMWDQFQVNSNSNDEITLEDNTAVMRSEDLVTVDSVTSLGGDDYELEITRTAGGPAEANDQEYDTYYLLDSANELVQITGTEYVADGSPSKIFVTTITTPVTGAAAIAYNFVAGAAFVNRDPVVKIRLYTKCPTFLYDPLIDVSSLGINSVNVINPHDILFSGGTLIGTPFLPGDTILTIQSGIALFVGASTSIVGNTLTDTSANFGTDDSIFFHFLNPNMNQTGTFKIVSNTSTSLTVESSILGVTLESVAAAGSNYCVLDFKTHRFYQLLVRLIQLMRPTTTRIFIFFAP